ncbi:MAG: hypothetical protein VX447_04465 [Pseudomonadota bacterium]|uniref:hypothetical protein n=1 Tax=Gallaecimonas pentaromativorans TaxID=584787 RepID=UPI00067E8341|nr:hypothetical protein [Gallaecimonas pentaromativorans]MED5523997.1 hypothetical protein [Pseudomonadota bacterium]
MRFKTVRDLIDHLAESHFALSKLYQRLASNADAERTRMMLHYLVDHEQKVADDYRDYLKHPHSAFDTWFDKAVDSDFIKQLTYVDIKANASLDDVLSLALEQDNKLLADIEALLPLCPGQESRQYLEGLLSSAKNIQQRFVHQTMRMQDL